MSFTLESFLNGAIAACGAVTFTNPFEASFYLYTPTCIESQAVIHSNTKRLH